MARFSEMLDRKSEEIKQPPLLPAGEYLMMGKKHPEIEDFTSAAGKNFDKIVFEMTVVEPLEVDPDALEEFGKVAGKTVRRQFFYNTAPEEEQNREMTMNQIKMFLESFGCFAEGMTVSEGFAGFANSQARVEITHRPDPNDPERFYLEVGRTYQA